MNKFINIINLCLSVCFFCMCGTKGNQAESKIINPDVVNPTAEGYSIIFYKLDDFAKIYINNSVVYNTSDVGMAPKEEILLDLNPFLLTTNSELKVELYNAECPRGCNLNRWEIIYELFNDGESVEFVSENSGGDTDDLGLKLTQSYRLN